jgi:hypothetical protein
MFDWFKSREERIKDYSVPPMVAPIEPPKQEQEHYSIGVTNDNRITLRIGYTTLTMNEKGVRNLIEQLELFEKHLKEETNNA